MESLVEQIRAASPNGVWQAIQRPHLTKYVQKCGHLVNQSCMPFASSQMPSFEAALIGDMAGNAWLQDLLASP